MGGKRILRRSRLTHLTPHGSSSALGTMKYRVLVIASLGIASASSAADHESRDTFKSYSECVVKLLPSAAAEVVLADDMSGEIKHKHPGLITPQCLDAGELKIPEGEFFLFGLAEALLRRDYMHGLPADIAKAAPLTHSLVDDAEFQPKPGKKLSAKQLADLEERDKHAHAIHALSIFAECVARANPNAALKLALSEPDSGYESNSFAALQPALSSCLDKGKSVALDKAGVRGAIALDLYRLAKAPRMQSTTSPPLIQNPVAVTHPKGDRQPLFFDGDYPAEARRNGWEGSVIADLTVTPEGRVSKCVIVQGSGHAILDSATCAILTTRAKFDPARDRGGNPVEDVVRTPPINWSL